MAERNLRFGTPAGRWVLLATVLGSGLAMLDATVVNIALPTIGKDFDAGLSSLQWVVNAYTLTLAGFLLLGGALGDRFGRRRGVPHRRRVVRRRVAAVRDRAERRVRSSRPARCRASAPRCSRPGASRSSRRASCPRTAPRRSARGRGSAGS